MKQTVIAILEAKPNLAEKLKTLLEDIVLHSRAETACIEYRLHQDKNNLNRFILYEIWQNEKMHEQQFEKPYIQNLAMQLNDLLEKPYEAYFAYELTTK